MQIIRHTGIGELCLVTYDASFDFRQEALVQEISNAGKRSSADYSRTVHVALQFYPEILLVLLAKVIPDRFLPGWRGSRNQIPVQRFSMEDIIVTNDCVI